ncbi:MAG: ATP-binding protein [Clostridia bacterium]|nr:ATP-binding protein [Clostridia bacterium]
MKELSLNILDIAENSVKAGAANVSLTIRESDTRLTFTVTDDGCGMTADFLARVTDPFCTTRKTRRVGLGLPFLKLMAEQTGGSMAITSRAQTEHPDDHGTTTTAIFCKDHIDCLPLGDIVSTVLTLIQGNPQMNFTFRHELPGGGVVELSTAELRGVLGDGVSLAAPEIILWMREYLTGAYHENQ